MVWYQCLFIAHCILLALFVRSLLTFFDWFSSWNFLNFFQIFLDFFIKFLEKNKSKIRWWRWKFEREGDGWGAGGSVWKCHHQPRIVQQLSSVQQPTLSLGCLKQTVDERCTLQMSRLLACSWTNIILTIKRRRWSREQCFRIGVQGDIFGRNASHLSGIDKVLISELCELFFCYVWFVCLPSPLLPCSTESLVYPWCGSSSAAPSPSQFFNAQAMGFANFYNFISHFPSGR